jgi:hypothetical protein
MEVGALQVSDEEREAHYEDIWKAGELLGVAGAYADIITNAASNETLCEFVRGKIRTIVNDPEVAETLCPEDFYIATKRPCLDTNYYETYNLPHVRLVDLREHPIETITETGIDTTSASYTFDAIVFATGFDAMTGALVGVDITGSNGLTLREKWLSGPETYLGLMTTGFPNLFTITGPGSPSVLSNMTVSIEQHVEWVSNCLDDLRKNNFEFIEPTRTAEAGWVDHVNDCGAITLLPQTNSWYTGANVPEKPRVFLPYIGGVGPYRGICDEVVERDYFGFVLEGPGKRSCNDGVIRTLQPDVAMVLDHVIALPSDRDKVEDAMARSVRWAKRCLEAASREDQARFAIVQGGLDVELRVQCATELSAMDFNGYAVGGLSVGEEPEEMYRITAATCPELPEHKPRYLMGVGRPIDLLESVARGIDLFDCVMPTRNGRNALAFTSSGQLKLRNAIHREDTRPLEQDCPCIACRHSRGYLRHLFIAGEMLGPILLSIHNLTYYQRLMRGAREAIEAGTFEAYLREKKEGWSRT